MNNCDKGLRRAWALQSALSSMTASAAPGGSVRPDLPSALLACPPSSICAATQIYMVASCVSASKPWPMNWRRQRHYCRDKVRKANRSSLSEGSRRMHRSNRRPPLYGPRNRICSDERDKRNGPIRRCRRRQASVGLSHLLPSDNLTVVANTGDDFTHLGLQICPDIDTVIYTLSDLADKERGWGRASETWNFISALGRLGGEDWFRLGDGDLAMHVYRTERLAAGHTLSEVTSDIALKLGIAARVVPMTDDTVATVVKTPTGELSFQHYFVRDRCEPTVSGFKFEGIEAAAPSPGFAASLNGDLDAILITPSILHRQHQPYSFTYRRRQRNLCCSSTCGCGFSNRGGCGHQGPAAKMMDELGMPTEAREVAGIYEGLIDGFVIDRRDEDQAPAIEAIGMAVWVTIR